MYGRDRLCVWSERDEFPGFGVQSQKSVSFVAVLKTHSLGLQCTVLAAGEVGLSQHTLTAVSKVKGWFRLPHTSVTTSTEYSFSRATQLSFRFRDRAARQMAAVEVTGLESSSVFRKFRHSLFA